MVEQRTDRLDAVFHALADPTRRAMLRSLTLSERSIGELADPFRMSFAAASKHVKALEKAGLVRRRIEGRTHMCQLEAHRLAEAHDWLSFYERVSTMRVHAMERELRRPEKRKKRSKP